MTRMIFIGTGGGRFATIYQLRSTGGLYIDDGVRLHIDPGPGALVRLHRERIDPTQTDAVLISHCHPDHYTDGEILIEAMTSGGTKKRGWIVGSESVLDGVTEYSPGISKYHVGIAKEVVSMKAGDRIKIGHIAIQATPSAHNDETSIGFKIFTKGGVISYISDTELRPEVVSAHKTCRVAVIACTRPLNARIPFHLTTEDAAEIVAELKPEAAFLTHFGLKVIRNKPVEQAKWIEEKTGIKTYAARDGMRVRVGDEVKVQKKKR